MIAPTKIQPDNYFSNLFTRQKKGGSYKTILNLKYLNEECYTQHFKMESIRHAIYMINPDMFLASLDTKDAFYSIPIHKTHQKFLKFLHKEKAFQFNARPNGYIDAMQIFNKVLKPPFAYLRGQGLSSVVYVDDTLLGGDTFEECQDNVFSTLTCLDDLGFYMHPEKSIFTPKQDIIFLGYHINTLTMTTALTYEKKQQIKEKVEKLLTKSSTIREVSILLGSIVASFEAVPNGRPHYRHIEFDQISALKQNRGSFEAKCYLSPTTIADLNWWKDNMLEVYRVLKSIPEVNYTMYSDASTKGRGAHDKHHTINGRWTEGETKLHINVLELTAIKFAIFSLLPLPTGTKHLRVMTDNSTAISYINRQGGIRSMLCNNVTTEIWEFCIRKVVYISLAHISGKENVIADLASREFEDSHERMLSLEVFKYLVELF